MSEKIITLEQALSEDATLFVKGHAWPVLWVAVGVRGHTHNTATTFIYTSDAPPVEADEYERMKQRAEAAERERDGFQQWANTLESAGWQDAGFCPHCGKDDVRKSIDVLEPDAAKEIHYCCSCGAAWVVGHKPPTRR